MAEDITTLWNKFSLMEEENKVVVVKNDDIYATLERGRFCLIGKFVLKKKKSVNCEAFNSNMVKVWKLDTTINIIDVGLNLFLFEFSFEIALQRV